MNNRGLVKVGTLQAIACVECRRIFRPVRAQQIYCCKRCANRSWKKRARRDGRSTAMLITEDASEEPGLASRFLETCVAHRAAERGKS